MTLRLALLLLAAGNADVLGAERSALDASAAESPSERISLFNGRDFAGLRTWLVESQVADPRHVFTVTNGVLRISGDGLGYVGTEKAYRDYLLIVEFRWGTTNSNWGERRGKARDSGVFLHANGPDGNSHDGAGAFMAAVECQVMEGAVGDFLLIRGSSIGGALIAPRVTVEAGDTLDDDGWPYWKSGGKLRTLQRWGRVNRLGKARHWRDEFGFQSGEQEANPGQWNQLECRCAGDRIVVRLNGRVVNEVAKVDPSQGRILLQCEGSEVFFRRFELLPLPGAASLDRLHRTRSLR